MMRMHPTRWRGPAKIFVALACLLLACGGCARRDATNAGAPASTLNGNRVVLYCSVDDVYARPIIKRLEAQTGLRVDVIYDTEAAKTAGLANRIRAEKARPQGDVFWSSALLQTLLLKRDGLLQPYKAQAATKIPAAFKDKNGYWTGLGARARVLIYHSSLKTAPRRLDDLLAPRLKNKVGISNPQFGTASDWVAMLGTRRGIENTRKYFERLKANGVRVLAGNAVVAEKVGRGELLAGVTDIDDYYAQKAKTPALRLARWEDEHGAPLSYQVPGSVALLQGAPHAPAARRFIEALLAPKTEQALAERMKGVLPLHGRALQDTPDDSARWLDSWQQLRDPLAELLLSD